MDVLFVNIAKFYYFFNDLDLTKLSKHVVKIDIQDIVKKVKVYFLAKKISKKSMLDGINLNEVTNSESPEQRRYLSPNQQNVYKLDHWLKRIKDQKNSSNEITEENKKIQLLDVQQSRRMV